LKPKFFRVKIGYGKDEFISISESELPMALRAQITGKIGVFSGGTVSGNHIISITPDWHKEFGYNPLHVLAAEDLSRLSYERKNEYQLSFEVAKEEAMAQIENRPTVHLPSKNEPTTVLLKTKDNVFNKESLHLGKMKKLPSDYK
jgi:hypothetical protein